MTKAGESLVDLMAPMTSTVALMEASMVASMGASMVAPMASMMASMASMVAPMAPLVASMASMASMVAQNALLSVFEDNDSAVKTTIKGKSPTMRHVSRTHGIALDWSFDRINLDPKIQIKYVDSKHRCSTELTLAQ